MKKFLAITSSVVMFLSLSTPALAASSLSINIKGNGTNSYNKVKFSSYMTKLLGQSNHSTVSNSINVSSNTGGNQANKNTGSGNVSVTSGDINTTVSVLNGGDTNTLNTNECGCEGEDTTEVTVKNNGDDSTNKVEIHEKTFEKQWQANFTAKINSITAMLNTGDNQANKNTGDGESDPNVNSGSVTTDITVINEGNTNTLN